MIEETEITEAALAARLLILQAVIGDGGLAQVVEGGMARLIRVEYVDGRRILKEIRGPLPIAEHYRDLRQRACEHSRRQARHAEGSDLQAHTRSR